MESRMIRRNRSIPRGPRRQQGVVLMIALIVTWIVLMILHMWS